MDSIDLNISNYSISELEDLLSLNTNYNVNMIQFQKTDLQTKIMSDASISFENRDEISKFIDQVASTLEEVLKKNDPPPPPTKFSELKQHVEDISGHFIIDNPNNVDRYSQPPQSGIISETGAPPGIINPIKYKTIKKTINIDSKFRPNYFSTNSSDLHIDLPERVDNIIKMSLTSLELPLSFYTFSRGTGNNIMSIRYEYKNVHTDKIYAETMVITLPDGNYEVAFVDDTGAKSIETAMNEALRAQIIGSDPNKPLNPLMQYLRYSVDPTSCKSLFAMTTDFVHKCQMTDPDDKAKTIEVQLLQWGIMFNVNEAGELEVEAPLPLRLGWYLGFRIGNYIAEVADNFSGAIASEGICYPKGPNYIFISIDDYCNNTNNYFKAIYNDSINNNNIFARINLASIISNSGVYSVGGDDSFSTSLSRSREYFGPVNIQKLRITIYDEYGRIVILNNMDWSICLMFECVYS